ncbi:hypothetical protein NX059_011708 [Plenodomus lindquistii]|nr:hypothetical protein NX059_011708 [Plenodomus lindquistii]
MQKEKELRFTQSSRTGNREAIEKRQGLHDEDEREFAIDVEIENIGNDKLASWQEVVEGVVIVVEYKPHDQDATQVAQARRAELLTTWFSVVSPSNVLTVATITST